MSSVDDAIPGNSSGDEARRLGGPGQEALAAALARLGLEGGLLLHALAERMGVAVTDLSCLLLLMLEGPASAGRLATRSGLTTGAITGVVDRLSRGGWVERQPDPEDRRRVVVRLVDARWPDLRRVLKPVQAAAVHVALGLDGGRSSLDSGTSGSAVAVRVLQVAGDAFAAGVERLRLPLDAEGDRAQLRPAVSAARLRLSAWSGSLVVRATDLGADLAHAPAASVTVRVRGGVVNVTPLHGRRRGEATAPVLEVHRDVAWEVEVAGGANRLTVDLGELSLTALSIGGGANRVELVLPAPSGPTPLHISGGANRVRISRPAGVPVSIRVGGGAHDIRLDGTRLDPGWGGEWGSDRSGRGGPRYDLDVGGGVSKLVVE